MGGQSPGTLLTSLAATFESAVERQRWSVCFLLFSVSLRGSGYSPAGGQHLPSTHSCKNTCHRWPLDLVPSPDGVGRFLLRQLCTATGLVEALMSSRKEPLARFSFDLMALRAERF